MPAEDAMPYAAAAGVIDINDHDEFRDASGLGSRLAIVPSPRPVASMTARNRHVRAPPRRRTWTVRGLRPLALATPRAPGPARRLPLLTCGQSVQSVQSTPGPQLRGSSTRRTRSSTSARATVFVRPSVDPSSTITISQSVKVWARTLATARGRTSPALKQGVTTDTTGAPRGFGGCADTSASLRRRPKGASSARVGPRGRTLPP